MSPEQPMAFPARARRPRSWIFALAAALITAASGISTLSTWPTDAGARSYSRPGDFDYYALVLSWSPTYCADRSRGRRYGSEGPYRREYRRRGERRPYGRRSYRRDPQCSGRRPYAFVLHGLWPQFERGWPQFCRTRYRPWVPREVIDEMLDIMPSPKLVIHEYKKHGTCAGLRPRAYFSLARRLYKSVKIPRKYRHPRAPITTTTEQIERDFLAANPELEASMISVSCGRRGRLRDVRICFDRRGRLRACSENERQRRLCRRDKIFMPPVRGGAPQPAPINREERKI